MLTLRLVFHLALHQAETFTRSVLALLGLSLCVPDHTTLSRCGRTIAGRQLRAWASSGPVHLVLDSTGLDLSGQDEWCAAKPGRLRRCWMKLRLGVDAITGKMAAYVLTEGHAGDAAPVPDLLRQPEGNIASLIADSAYDGEDVYWAAAAREPGKLSDVVIPSRASTMLSTADPDKQSPRDDQCLTQRGYLAWRRMTDCGRRNAAITIGGMYKRLIGPDSVPVALPLRQARSRLPSRCSTA